MIISELFTTNRFLKIVVLIIIVALPFVGFVIGTIYQEGVMKVLIKTPEASLIPKVSNLPNIRPVKDKSNTIYYQIDKEFSLKVGQEAFVVNTGKKEGFRLVSIVDDTRCPSNVVCVWSGEMVVWLEVFEREKNTKYLLSNLGLMDETYQPGNLNTRQILSKGVPLSGGKLVLIKALPFPDRDSWKNFSETKYEIFFKVN